MTTIHPCSMSDTVYKEAEAAEQLDQRPPETRGAVAEGCNAPLLTQLRHTDSHLCIQQVEPHTMLHYIIIIGGVPVAKREAHESASSPALNSDENTAPHAGTRSWAGSHSQLPQAAFSCHVPRLLLLCISCHRQAGPHLGKAEMGQTQQGSPLPSVNGDTQVCSRGSKHQRDNSGKKRGGLSTEQGVPGHHPTTQAQLPWQPCSSPLAQDDSELRVVQAGDRHIRQLKLLQLPYNCREQQLSSSSVLGEPPGPPPPSAGPPAPCTGLSLWGKVLLSPPPGQMAHAALVGLPSTCSTHRRKLHPLSLSLGRG